MSVNGKHIDDVFRDKEAGWQPGLDSHTTGWEQMNSMLDQKGPAPRVRKRITRRVITWLGAVAVVTTVTYYTVTRNRSNKQQPVTMHSKTPAAGKAEPARATITRPQDVPIAKSAIVDRKTTTVKKPSAGRYTRIAQFSDTVFQTPPRQQQEPIAMRPAGNVNWNDFYRSMQEPPQLFEIDTQRDTLLFGNSGTVIKIPAYVFYGNNKVVKGKVTIALTECYHYKDMLAHRLSTVSGQLPLVTGGMIKLEARSEGKTLQLLNGTPIGVAMPMERYDPEMQLFLPGNVRMTGIQEKNAPPSTLLLDSKGDTVTITPVPQVRDTIATSLIFETVDNWQPAGQVQAWTAYREYTARRSIKLFDLRQKIKGINEGDEGYFIIRTGNSISDDKVKQLIARRYSAAGYKKIHIERVKDFDNEVSAKKTQVSITGIGFVASDSVTMNFNEALKEQLISKADSINFMIGMRQDSIAFFEKRKADSLAYVKKIAFNRAYSFDITSLGWINCDRFMKSAGPQIEFTVNPGEQLSNGNAFYYLVFSNFKSVLRGNYANGLVNFGKLPVGEPVQVVCVTENNGQPMGCVQRTVIGGEAMARLRFEPVTAEIFREKLMKLD